MKKMPREKLIKKGEEILSESGIVAKHGTNIASAQSIMENGLYIARETFVIHENSNTYGLMTYGYKTTLPGDSANVIISVPKEFLKMYFGFDDEICEKFISDMRENNHERLILSTVIHDEYIQRDDFADRAKAIIPKEFIKGVFVYTDNKTYKDFSDDWDLGLDYLGYVENKEFFNNLSEEGKKEVVDRIKDNVFGGEDLEFNPKIY